MTLRHNFAFRLVGLTGPDGQCRTHVVVDCSNCTNQLSIPSIGARPPQHIAKSIRQRDWEFDLYNRHLIRCPECIEIRNGHRSGESGRKVVSLFNKPVSVPVRLVAESPFRPEPKPLCTYTVIVRTRRSEDELRQTLSKSMEVLTLLSEPVEPQPPTRTYVERFRKTVDQALSKALMIRPSAPPQTLAKYLNRVGIKPYGKAREWTSQNIVPHLNRHRADHIT